MKTSTPTVEELRSRGHVTDLTTACRLLGISRSEAYRLAGEDRFPVPIIATRGATGRPRYRVPVAPLLAALGLDDARAGA